MVGVGLIDAAAASTMHASIGGAARATIHPGRTIEPAADTAALFARRYRQFLLMHEHQCALKALQA